MDVLTPTGLTELGIRWGEPDEEAMRAIRDSRVATKLLEALRQEVKEQLREEMRTVLLQGVQQGLHPYDVARNLQNAVGAQLGSAQARMNNIARTEQLDAYRASGKASAAANTDVVTGWMWICMLDQTSCPSCIAQHGTVHDNSENGPDDHPQGRCYRMPQTKSWADLGFDVPEPPSLVPDNETWFGKQSEEVQRNILGPSRYAAWRDGEYPMSKWSVEVENERWRRSFQVSSLHTR